MKTLVNILSSCLFAVIIFAFAACDTESVDDSQVLITPQNATIAKGESITFTASGGYEYNWILEDESWATLSNYRGESTVYTSLQDSSSNGVATVRVLKVSSSIPGSGTASNSTDATYAETHVAEAYITHVASPDETEAPVAIRPDSVEISARDVKEFTASGGNGSYSWSIKPDTYGELSGSSGDKVAYIADDTNVTATVVLTVSSGNSSDIAHINHNP